MEAALKGLGFTVEKVLNGTLDQMESAAIRLKNRLSASKNSYGFLFYAGHGVQANGDNYLIPVDANIPSDSYLRQRAVSVQTVLDDLNKAENALNVVILDACRDNPLWLEQGRGPRPPGGIAPARGQHHRVRYQRGFHGGGRNGKERPLYHPFAEQPETAGP